MVKDREREKVEEERKEGETTKTKSVDGERKNNILLKNMITRTTYTSGRLHIIHHCE